jgi:hypothetical protein
MARSARKTTVADLDKQLAKLLEEKRHQLRNAVLEAIEDGVEQLDVEQARTWLADLREDFDLKLAALDEQIQWAKEHGQ